ncbi:MAG: hypothetical protein AAF810_02365 [Cyanobacteria bacterium P01_D01_bin.36]
MAKMTFGDVRAHVEEKGLLLVSEPASGSGALVIAMIQIMVTFLGSRSSLRV